MFIKIQPFQPEHLSQAGAVLEKSFGDLYARHGLASSRGAGWGPGLLAPYLNLDPGWGVVALVDGRVVGSCFAHPRGGTAAIGPMSVDPEYQGQKIGRQILESLLEMLDGVPSIRLLRHAFNVQSFSLYFQAGFVPCESAAKLTLKGGLDPHSQGLAPEGPVWRLQKEDLPALVSFDRQRTGLERGKDFDFLLRQGGLLALGRPHIKAYLAFMESSGGLSLGPGHADRPEDLIVLVQEAVRNSGQESVTFNPAVGDGKLLRAALGLGFRINYFYTFMSTDARPAPPGYYSFTTMPESH